MTYDKDDADELRMPRYKMFRRCIRSVKAQTFKDFEWVIGDDKCNPSLDHLLAVSSSFRALNPKVVKIKEKSGRIIAANAALKASTGEWICLLDADDEYSSIYLELMNNAIEVYPEIKVFNFNHLMFNYDYSMYVRKFINMAVQGDKPFPSGTIGTGAFILHRSVMNDIGLVPELGLWELADWAFKKFPEVKPFYLKNDGGGNYNSLGNPWGSDWLWFYMITRKYKSQYIDTAPYFVHSRWGHSLPGSIDFVKDPGAKPRFDSSNV